MEERVALEYISHAILWEWTCRQIEIDYTLIGSENELVLTHVSKFLNWFSSLLLYIQVSFNYELNASFKVDLFYNWLVIHALGGSWTHDLTIWWIWVSLMTFGNAWCFIVRFLSSLCYQILRALLWYLRWKNFFNFFWIYPFSYFVLLIIFSALLARLARLGNLNYFFINLMFLYI